MKIRIRQSYELLDKVNTKINRYKQRPIFDLIDFYHTRSEDGYIYLHVVVQGERDGAPINVYQILGSIVTLEKINDLLYRYVDPEDEMYTSRTFEVEVIIGGVESKKKQTTVISSPTTYYLTSQIYPINFIDETKLGTSNITGRILTTNDLRLYQSIFEEGKLGINKLNGIFKQSLFVYLYKDDSVEDQQKPNYESFELKLNKINGILRQLLIQNSPKPENVKTVINKITGTLRQLLINYTYWAPEILKANVNKIEGSFTYFPTYFESYISGNTSVYDPNDSDNGVTIIQKSITSDNKKDVNDKGIAYKSHNTSVLDFENGLTDRVNSGVTWSKEGTGDLTSSNRIYGSNSFETKALGDSLYTNSNIITGGSTPFTIEFYALIKGRNGGSSSSLTLYPLISKDNDSSNGDQFILYEKSNGGKLGIYRDINGGGKIDDKYINYGKNNIYLNEINKYNITYDGVALRFFINNKLDMVLGTTNGFKSTTTMPFKFMETYIPTWSQYRSSTNGIIDNINIFDGIATKVRDYDPYEEYLIVDLAFDGENNSTNIVDNGTLGLTWNVHGNAKINTAQKFDGFSSLSLDGNGDYLKSPFNPIFQFNNEDLTFKFKIKLNAFGLDSSQSAILSTWQSSNSGGYDLRISNTHITIVFWTPSVHLYRAPFSFALNTEYDITVVRRDMYWIFYINNSLISSFLQTQSYTKATNSSIVIGSGIDEGYTNQRDLNGYIKDFQIYKGVAIPPKQKTNYLINANVSSSKINSNLTWNTTNAAISSDYFTGYLLNTSGNSAFNFYGSNFTLKYKFKGYGNLLREWNTNLRYMLSINSSGVVSFNFYETGPTQRTITTNSQTLSSDINELELTRSNGYFFIKLNGIPYTVTQTGAPYSGNIYGPTTEGVVLGDTGVITYSIDIYTEKSEDLDKIQLDFDNNVIDKYGNSTWTNNGVTFDNVNSIKGHAAYFNGSSNLQSNGNTLLNFENKNFNIEFDGNKLNNNQTYSSWLTTSGASYPSQWCELSSWNTNLQRFQNLAASAPELTGAVLNLNTWYKWQLTRNNGVVVLKANDVVTGISNYTPSMNVNFNNGTGTNLIGVSSNAMNCYLDNFKSQKDYKGEIIVDKPAVHLPLETSSTNIGFSDLTINSVGSPTYTTIDGKKCIKFESGKYLSINSNNIFNLGTNSDFYLEFDFNLLSVVKNALLSNLNQWTRGAQTIYVNGSGYLTIQDYDYGVVYASSNMLQLNTWNKISILRKNNIIKISINGITENASKNVHLDLSVDKCYIGCSGWDTSERLNGYMSNFKMFVGTSEIPETYDDKKVLDLDFKPTRKSYLFKDNNNKCIIHPINITQRDYQDSQYCCTFDGVNQGITLAKNPALNIGKDDYVMYIRFKVADFTNVHQRLISDNYSNTGALSYVMITGDSYSNTSLTRRLFIGYSDSSAAYSYSITQLEANTIYDAVFVRSGDTTNTYINGKLEATFNSTLPFDLNFQDETFIGRAGFNTPVSGTSSQMFKGTIYKVQIYRNTTDTSVLNLPILNTPSTIYLPLIKDSIDIRTGATWTNNASMVVYENEAAKFDGNSATYLNTGVTSDFNYATNDFTVGFDTYKSGNQSEARILSSMANNPSIYPRTEIKQSQGMGLTLSNYTNSSEVMYKTYKTGDVLNNWNKSRFIKTNNTLYTYINDSLVDMVTIPNGTQFNLNTNNGTRISGVGHTTSSSYFYQGYIKNVYSNNTATTSDILPYLYMPYDTSLTDFGVNNLSITNSTTSASVLDTLNGVKCTRITTVSTNPYITMTLGSVFTIKAKIYIPTKASSGYNKPLFGTGYNSNIGFLLSQFTEPWSGNANPQLWLRTSGSNISFAINGLIGTWIDIIVTKTLTTLTLNVNGVDVGSMNNSNWNNSDFKSSRTFYIGDAGTDWKESSTFYIKDFRFYKGLPSIPTNEVLSKKVLDLKFKKDDARVYPFKDESRRHIVSYNAMSKYNLVNIEGVDCAQFNGIDQYLELGNTKLMNFGNEDFVIAFKIYIIPYVHTGSSQWQVILASGGTSSSSNVSYIAYDQTTKSLVIRATDNEVYRISNVLNECAWNTVIITRTGDKFNTIINNNINNGVISSTANFNLNYNANTYIGINKWNSLNEYLKGYLTDLQVVKGSSDITLLDLNSTETITIVNPPKTVYYPMVMNEVDAFNVSWYQTNSTNLVKLKEFNKGENTALYFDGISGLISSNYCYSIGLNKFTFECSILISSTINASYPVKIFMSNINGNSYINTFRYWLEVTSTGILRFTTNNGSTYYSTPANTIGYNQKYHIEVSRDDNRNLRIFVNGVSLVEDICNDSIGSQTYDHITYQSYLSLVLGKNADYYSNTVNYGNLIGMIENFYFIKGICKHTSNFTPTVPLITLNPNKTLLNVNSSLGTNPSTIIDVGNNITYANTGSTVEATPSNSSNIRNYSLRSQSTATRIVSSVSASTFNLTNENWTIDLVFIPSQTSAEAYLLDTRINSTIFRGIVVRQPETSPSSIRVEIGSTTASSYDISYTSPNNSLVIGTRYHLKIVKCRERILIFLNGSELGNYNWGIKEIGYTDRVILFNNDLFNKGFNGYLLQFRYIKKIATDTRSYTDITEELK